MSKYSYAYGIDVGGTTVKCGLFQVDGTYVESWEIPTRTVDNGKNVVPDIAETIRKNMEEHGLTKKEVAGVGIGVPGPV
ncbi:MAG: ROK family protein, partial [Lachnospiraceae bacterium]|nr:ROK family protein [Lachnospiraceae bacterium]